MKDFCNNLIETDQKPLLRIKDDIQIEQLKKVKVQDIKILRNNKTSGNDEIITKIKCWRN